MSGPGPGGVLALDLSRTTGWAYGGINDREPISGVWHLPGLDNLGRAFCALVSELEAACSAYQPGWVIAERPLFEKRQTSASLLQGLSYHAESTCFRLRIPFADESSTTIRARVMGRGRFPTGTAKDHVIAWCARQGWTGLGDDEADARVTWIYGCLLLRGRRVRAA